MCGGVSASLKRPPKTRFGPHWLCGVDKLMLSPVKRCFSSHICYLQLTLAMVFLKIVDNPARSPFPNRRQHRRKLIVDVHMLPRPQASPARPPFLTTVSHGTEGWATNDSTSLFYSRPAPAHRVTPSVTPRYPPMQRENDRPCRTHDSQKDNRV